MVRLPGCGAEMLRSLSVIRLWRTLQFAPRDESGIREYVELHINHEQTDSTRLGETVWLQVDR